MDYIPITNLGFSNLVFIYDDDKEEVNQHYFYFIEFWLKYFLHNNMSMERKSVFYCPN